jgi:protoporphyrinogen oxidase
VTKVVILGAGLAGITLARAIAGQHEIVLLEQARTVGGTSSSFSVGEFTFDHGIHGLYTADQRVLATLTNAVQGAHHTINVQVADMWSDIVAPRPLQSHLAWLPPAIAAECLSDLIAAQTKGPSEPVLNYEQWCIATFGCAFSSRFLLPYAAKFWTVNPAELTCNWMGERARVPTIEEATRGATLRAKQSVHYVRTIYYPNKGGFGEYARKMAAGLQIEFDAEVVQVDDRRRSVTLSSGGEVAYDMLISTIPLPALVSLIKDVPDSVREPAAALRSTSLALVSICVRGESQWPYHWIYSYDVNSPFARLSSPSLWADANAPSNCWSLQAETYFRGQPPDSGQLTRDVVRWLIKSGIVASPTNIISTDVRYVQSANVIHDHHHVASSARVLDFVESRRIVSCGRYGRWDYSLVDDVIRGAEEAAQVVLTRAAGARVRGRIGKDEKRRRNQGADS